VNAGRDCEEFYFRHFNLTIFLPAAPENHFFSAALAFFSKFLPVFYFFRDFFSRAQFFARFSHNA